MGFVVMVGSLFSFLLLFVMDAMAHLSNPYLGILTYLVAPGFLVIGLVTLLVGAWLRHRQIVKAVGPFAPIRIDLTRPRDRRFFGWFLAGSVMFLLISGGGQLPKLSLHRVGAILRSGMSRGDEA
jgi:hypothetical protein